MEETITEREVVRRRKETGRKPEYSNISNTKMHPHLFAGARQPLPPEDFKLPESLDRLIHAWLVKLTPPFWRGSIMLAYFDWLVHLAKHPYHQMKLNRTALEKIMLFSTYVRQSYLEKEAPPMMMAKPQDKRFKGDLWKEWPFSLYQQGFLLIDEWWDNATRNVPGVSRHHEDIVNFTMRQIIDAFSPSVFPFMNPYVIETTLKEGGMNFIEGAKNYWEDYKNWLTGKPPVGMENFVPGKDVAVTPGKVIFRNRLIELIQYDAQTEKVYPEPLLIVPAWIMKYYILDLSPHNSLVKYLVENGHTVFMISWKNPDSEDCDLSLEDYLNLGILDAINIIREILPDQKIHATGYCLGGTLLMMAAAFLAKSANSCLGTITNLATQIDFEEAGELMLFIDESQLDEIEDIMWEKGYLDGSQMAGAFYLLRSNDLIWSKIIQDYQLGKRQILNDLMAWNADATRMPFKMHSQYLRRLFLNNELSEGRNTVNNKTIALTDIRAPIFSVATVSDHVAPWESVYKIHLYSDADVTFVLTSGGHNAGIVSEIGHPRRQYQISISKSKDVYIEPSVWAETVPVKNGSWWPEWEKWLSKNSGSKINASERIAAGKRRSICRAPGSYVHAR